MSVIIPANKIIVLSLRRCVCKYGIIAKYDCNALQNNKNRKIL